MALLAVVASAMVHFDCHSAFFDNHWTLLGHDIQRTLMVLERQLVVVVVVGVVAVSGQLIVAGVGAFALKSIIQFKCLFHSIGIQVINYLTYVLC